MALTVLPSKLHGLVAAPPSKSDFQRACAAALLHDGPTTLLNLGTSADDEAALQLAVDLGLEIGTRSDTALQVYSSGKPRPRTNTVFCGESGLATRLFIPIAALSDQQITFTGKGSLLSRPFDFFYEVLPQLGVRVSGNGTTLPITVQGLLQPKSLTVDGSLSSQFSSGLLVALSAAVQSPVTLSVTNAVSQPYLDMTVATLRAFGKNIVPEGFGTYRIFPENASSGKVVSYAVEGDWSSSAVWVIAAALGAELSVIGLSAQSLQADRMLVEVLEQTGLTVRFDSGTLTVTGTATKGFLFDATHAPDLVPVLAVLAFSVPGGSRISGLHRLIHKESNRLESVTQLLTQGGIYFTVSGNELIIPGGQQFGSCEVDAFNDHRLVMAATLAAFRASGPVTITGQGAIRKSYPAFFADLQALGGRVEKD